VAIVNVIQMTNDEKAVIYDQCLRESDRLQRENSKLKSEYTTNIPFQIEETIRKNDARIAILVNRLESLFR